MSGNPRKNARGISKEGIAGVIPEEIREKFQKVFRGNSWNPRKNAWGISEGIPGEIPEGALEKLQQQFLGNSRKKS